MTDADRKLLTEKLLGKCWHEFHMGYNYEPHGPICKEDEGCPNQCKKCHKGNNIWLIKNRTFTTPDDFFAVFNTLVEKGWSGFYWWAIEKKWIPEVPGKSFDEAESTKWLLGKNTDGVHRLCTLAAEWMGKERGL